VWGAGGARGTGEGGVGGNVKGLLCILQRGAYNWNRY
jgi:hypothetical protein